jgi:hypothetical protein
VGASAPAGSYKGKSFFSFVLIKQFHKEIVQLSKILHRAAKKFEMPIK